MRGISSKIRENYSLLLNTEKGNCKMKYDRIEDFDIQNVRYMTQLNVLTVVKL